MRVSLKFNQSLNDLGTIMDFNEHQNPANLIQKVFELRLPIRAVFDNNLELTLCKLVREAGSEREILIQAEL